MSRVDPATRQVRSGNPGRSRGRVLAISLISLVVLTLIAVTLTKTTALEDNIAASLRHLKQAFSAPLPEAQDDATRD